MVNTSTVIAVCVTLFLTLPLPLAIYIAYALRCKGKGVWSAWLLGAAGFVVMQLFLRVPALRLLQAWPPMAAFAAEHFIFYSLFLAVTAALFEVAARYGVAKLLERRQLSREKAAAAGLGHGGIESICLVGITYVNNLIYIAMVNSGTFDVEVARLTQAGVDATALLSVKEALLQTSPAIFYLAGYERLLTMLVHLALSFLVCYGVWRGKAGGHVFAAFVFHCGLDFVIPILNALSTPYLGNRLSPAVGMCLTYSILTCFAALAAYILVKTWRRWIVEQHSAMAAGRG